MIGKISLTYRSEYDTILDTIFTGGVIMRLKENIKPITYMKTYASQLIAKVQETHHPVIITQHGEARAVLQDIDSYERMHNAFLMLKLLVQGEIDISKDNVLENELVMERLEEKLMSGKR